MRYGVSLGAAGLERHPRALAELAALAEASGWDGMFLEDYLVYQGRDGMPTYDPSVVLAAMAMVTTRIRLGTTRAEVEALSIALGQQQGARGLIDGIAALRGPDLIGHTADGILARASFRPVQDGRVALMGASAVAGCMATATITVDEADRDWALDAWRSIRSLRTSA